MKRKLYITFFLAPLIIVLAFFMIGAQSGRQVNNVIVNPERQFTDPGKSAQPSIVPGVVMVKIKSREVAQSLTKATTMTGLMSLDAKLSTIGAIRVEKAFRHKPIPINSNIPDISRILRIEIPERLSPLMVARELERDPNVEYAEPVYERRLCAVPNDPMYSQQQHLPQIHAPEAWDVQKGDSTVIIGIVDTGVDYFHEDLANNVWTNELEANGVTGVDDDGNGFVDDIHGWDFADNDADPSVPISGVLVSAHGTHIAGIACAVTNNGIGIAGVSWNCKYLPIKVFHDDGEATDITPFYDGIVYAADNGADIISNSWGLNQYLKWEQDVINYAHGKGAIVVCAAANINSEIPIYPASYQNAISVAAVDITDHKTSYSNFGAWIDICAPGGDDNAEILSTMPGNKYANWQGTSMATPVIAGVFGLVKSQHPEWSNDQIVRQVLLTADDIDARNPQYTDRLGYGRVDAARAVTVNPNDLLEPEARLAVFSIQIDDSLSGDGDGVLDRGETIQLNCEIQNCSIGSASATTLQLTCTNADVQILEGIKGPLFFPPDSILSFAFTFRIAEQAAAHASELVLKMRTDGGYYREEKIPIPVGLMPLLFVDYDLGEPKSTSFPEVDPVYRDILNKNNLLYGYWDIDVFGFPKESTLVKFPTVIVAASSPKFWEFVLGEQARDNLRSYLNGGGHLFICGQDVGVHLFEVEGTEESKAFMRDYLHAEYIANDSQDHNVSGVTKDPISHNLSFHVWQPVLWEGWQWPDVIAPTTGASTIFTYSDSRAAAVKYAGDHKVVYFGFGGLEAVDSYANTQIGDLSPIRTELFMRILNWLNFIEHEPLTMTEDITNPRTITTEISSNVTELQAVTLFWRLQGETDFTAVPMTETEARHFTMQIPGPGAPATIEYYIQTTHPYYNWQSPVDAPNTVHSYYVGPDTVAPTISQFSKLINRLGSWQPCPLSIDVTDNLGIDISGVIAHYRVLNRFAADSVMLMPSGGSSHFTGELPTVFFLGDTVEYYISARDVSEAGNTSTSPWQRFQVGYEDFEHGLDNWQVDPESWGLSFTEHTGRYSVCSSPQGFYEMGQDGSLTSKYGVDLSQTNKAVLTFWTAYFIEENSDFGYIEISRDSAVTWQQLGTVFTGINGGWNAASVSLSAFTGHGFTDVRIRFRFISDSTQSQGMVGWYIDDVRVIPGIEVGITVPGEKIVLPQSFLLYQNYPNPFNAATTIEFALPKSAFVTLKVYNLLGEEVATLIAEQRSAGIHRFNWDARGLASGVYLYRLEASDPTNSSGQVFVQSKKLILMR